MKIILLVIDSFGIGEMPDSKLFGDKGSNTYVNIVKKTGVKLNNLIKLGLNNINGLADKVDINAIDFPQGAYAKLSEKTFAKDTTSGHYEICGIIMDKPYPIYKSFPAEILSKIESEAEVKFIGNYPASGTEIIKELGEEHLQSGNPIIYTSQDSVMQIASDTSIIPLEKLYKICEIARKIMVEENNVSRVIARPFIHNIVGGKLVFKRTEDRKDYALQPPTESLLDILKRSGVNTIAVGKIDDIFCGNGILKSYHTKNNADGIKKMLELSVIENINFNIEQLNGKEILNNVNKDKNLAIDDNNSEKIIPKSKKDTFIFVNLVDTDMLYGHRNDVDGYAEALKKIDEAVLKVRQNLDKDDIFIITADHGCDPTTESTDHSREYVPLLICGDKIKSVNLGEIYGFDCISNFVLNILNVKNNSLNNNISLNKDTIKNRVFKQSNTF